MANERGKRKDRLLFILQYLINNTDDEHRVSQQELADLCVRLLSDPARLEAMGAAGRQIPRKNAAERIYAALSGMNGEQEGIE